MSELFLAFTLGNAAILTNACLLPLYPGLIAFLAGNSGDKDSVGGGVTMGALVLAGILTMMTFIGFILSVLSASFGDILPILLPIIYIIVIVLGVLMLRGMNPFAKMETMQAPVLKNTYLRAYVYGLFFAPMTLPCAGPIILGAFTIGGTATAVIDGLLYFFFFGLGFGWPLLVLPIMALPLQRRIVRWLAGNHLALTRASGMLLLAVGIFGITTELLPIYLTDFEFGQSAQLIFWVLAFIVTFGIGYWTYTQENKPQLATENA